LAIPDRLDNSSLSVSSLAIKQRPLWGKISLQPVFPSSLHLVPGFQAKRLLLQCQSLRHRCLLQHHQLRVSALLYCYCLPLQIAIYLLCMLNLLLLALLCYRPLPHLCKDLRICVRLQHVQETPPGLLELLLIN